MRTCRFYSPPFYRGGLRALLSVTAQPELDEYATAADVTLMKLRHYGAIKL